MNQLFAIFPHEVYKTYICTINRRIWFDYFLNMNYILCTRDPHQLPQEFKPMSSHANLTLLCKGFIQIPIRIRTPTLLIFYMSVHWRHASHNWTCIQENPLHRNSKTQALCEKNNILNPYVHGWYILATFYGNKGGLYIMNKHYFYDNW